MIKINYEGTYSFTSEDILDTSDTHLTFKARARHKLKWAETIRSWMNDEKEPTPEEVRELMSLSFVSVQQNGKEYPISTIEAVTELRDSLEAQNPGMGDDIISQWVVGQYFYHFQRLGEKIDQLKKS